MKPYSLDLRQKIVEAYQRGDRSQRKVAQQIGVATSFVQKLLKQYKETGDIAPKVRQQQTPTKLMLVRPRENELEANVLRGGARTYRSLPPLGLRECWCKRV